MTMKRKSQQGFTLTELLIVIAILAVLVAVAIPVISGLMKKGNDTSEDVNAAYFTSIMQKFAVEEVDTAPHYPRLTTTGADAEYDIFSSKAGNGTFPGYNIIATSSNAEVLSEIRKEAVIAIKAFGDTAVSDDYFIQPPADSEYEYVYYYLTGDVKKAKRSDMTTASADDFINGSINVEDYWVYLSREGGSGAALGGVNGDEGFLFVQVLQFGTSQPLIGANVTVTAGSKTFRATTQDGQKGYVGFTGVPKGAVNISVSYPGAVSFPNASYYSKSGEVVISGNGYEGCQLNSPYVVELKLGSLGSLGFYEETQTWRNGTWVTSREKITTNTNVTSAFTATSSTARSETYTSNMNTTQGTQPLLTDRQFLTYGKYGLTVSSYGYRTYRESVEAKVYGIDNNAGQFSGFTSPYEYPIVMKSPAGQSGLSGIIGWESSYQLLYGYPSGLQGSWAYTKNYSVTARVKVTNISTGTAYYSDTLTPTTSGKYAYSISGLPDGNYRFEIESPYHYTNLSNFPSTFSIDGRHVVISGDVLKTNAGYGSLSGVVTYDSLGNYDPIPGATVKLKRNGDSAYAATLTTDLDGKFSASSLRCGFYQMTVTAPAGYGGTTYYYKLFVSDSETCSIRLQMDRVSVSGTVNAYKNASTKMTKVGTMSTLSLKFQRVNSDGTRKYSTVTASVSASSVVHPTYSVMLSPGYYIVTGRSTCYSTITSRVINVTAASTTNFSMYVDTSNALNHYDLVFTCDSTGHWYECQNCDTVFDKSAHSESDWTYYSTSSCYKYCTVCNYKTQGPSAHTMSSYVSKAATCTATGTRTYYCTKGCGYSYTETIAKGGHVANGIWVYDNNGSSSSVGTHHQNCKVCGATMNAGTACTRGGFISNGASNHYDSCSKCSGKRYFDHSWSETSRSGYACTGGTIYYKCSKCGATKTGSYGATSAHNMKARCSVRHSCSWNTYCTAGGTHVWNGYYHIMCTMCKAVDEYKWCAMHCGNIGTVWTCPY